MCFATWSLTLREECRLRVFENRVLRRIFGPKRDEGTGKWRKICNEKLNELYSSPDTSRMIKLRRMVWVGRAARMGRVEVYTGFWWGNLKERDYLDDPGVDGRIILRRIFKKWDVRAWAGSMWLGIGQEAGTCECGNEHSGSIQCEEFLD